MSDRDERPAGPTARGQHGATLVEYVLVFTFLVVIAVTAGKAMTGATTKAVSGQADCVSTRPPPPSCQAPSATTIPTTTLPTTTTVAPSTTTTKVGATTTTTKAVTTTTVAPAIGTVTVAKISSPRGGTATIVVKSGGIAVPGAVVRFTATYSYAGTTATDVVPFTCTTNASGTCSVTATAPFTDTKAMQIKVIGIDATPPASSMPADPAPVTYP